MGYQTVLLHVNSHHQSAELMAFTAGLAEHCGAHLICSVPSGFPTLVVGDAYGGSAHYLQLMQQELDDAAAEAARFVNEQCQRLGIASYEVRRATDSAIEATISNSRYADLVMLEQPDPEGQEATDGFGFVGDVLLSVTRPVLIVPRPGSSQSVFERILIGWNTSNEAARAVAGALPLLKRAKLVQVAVVNAGGSGNDHGGAPGAELVSYLARHGVNIEVCALQVASDPAYALFQQASEFGADLMVVGAYGHSRLREWVLGGTTREILRSMKMPVLMAH